VKKKKTVSFWMKKHCVNSNQKIQHKKVTQLTFLDRIRVLMLQSIAYGLLWSSTQWHNRMIKKKVILVEFLGIFSGKIDCIQKYKDQQSNIPSDLEKGLKLHENKRKTCCLATCDE